MGEFAEKLPEELTGSRRDVVAFGGAYVVGLALYYLLHMILNVNQLIITSAILAVMLAYATFVVSVPQLRVRLDQAGDNAYYLGLLFTLTSMGFALYEFGVEVSAERSGVDQIISNFGIALASTVAGIFLRVILHQMRVDPAEVENMTRIELAEASRRVRASLDVISGDLNVFHDEVRQKTGDVVNALLTSTATALTGVADDVTRVTRTMLANTAATQGDVLRRTTELTQLLGGMATEAQGAVERLKSVKAPTVTLANRLDKTSAALEALASQLSGLMASFGEAGTTAAKASTSMADSAGTLINLSKGLAQSQSDVAMQLEAAVKKVQDAVGGLGGSLQLDRKLLSDLGVQSRTSAEQALRAQNAATQVLGTLTELTRELAELAKKAS